MKLVMELFKVLMDCKLVGVGFIFFKTIPLMRFFIGDVKLGLTVFMLFWGMSILNALVIILLE